MGVTYINNLDGVQFGGVYNATGVGIRGTIIKNGEKAEIYAKYDNVLHIIYEIKQLGEDWNEETLTRYGETGEILQASKELEKNVIKLFTKNDSILISFTDWTDEKNPFLKYLPIEKEEKNYIKKLLDCSELQQKNGKFGLMAAKTSILSTYKTLKQGEIFHGFKLPTFEDVKKVYENDERAKVGRKPNTGKALEIALKISAGCNVTKPSPKNKPDITLIDEKTNEILRIIEVKSKITFKRNKKTNSNIFFEI